MIRKISYLVGVVLLFTAYSCTKEVDGSLFSRPEHPNDFRTTLDGELYAYTRLDTAILRKDYFMRVQGYLMNYGEAKIIKYGHCWSKGENSTPNLSKEEFMTEYSYSGKPGDSIPFESDLINLDENTAYNIASYVMVEKDVQGKKVTTIGYNPEIATIRTRPALDEWFEQYSGHEKNEFKPSTAKRFDALAFNLGDTLFYGTGGQGQGIVNNVIHMYAPDKGNPYGGTWSEIPIIMADKNLLPNKSVDEGFMDGIGFAIEYQRDGDPPGDLTRSIFIGFGDHGGKDNKDDKSNMIWEYALNKNEGWQPRAMGLNRRSGTVCFVLQGKAFIGTGSHIHNETENNWIIYDPVLATSSHPTHGIFGLKATSTPTVRRKGAVAFVMDGVAYFGLGTDGGGNFFKDFWRFTPNRDIKYNDTKHGSWEKLTNFPGEPRANAVAFTIGDFGYIGTGDNVVAKAGYAEDQYFMEDEGKWEGTVFNDFYRFNKYTNTWRKVRDYTANKGEANEEVDRRKNVKRPIPRAVAFSAESGSVAYVGYGLIPPKYDIPNPPEQYESLWNSQQDFWKYQPFETGSK